MIAIVDAGLGNLRSVEKALRHVGADAVVTDQPEVIRRASRIVVPGQGAFGDCGKALGREAPLGKAIVDGIAEGKPYLGICLGLQILFESSEEAPDCKGLGILRGRVARIPDGLPDGVGGRLKVPHMGWNAVVAGKKPHPILAATYAALQHSEATPELPFYFVHSYHALPSEPFLVEATASYGDLAITAAVAARNIFAVQFHPEKSQAAGLALLRAFVEWQC